MYLLVPFNIQNFEKSLEMIQSYEDTPIWGTNCAPKWSICPEQDSFWSTNNLTLISLSFTVKKNIEIRVHIIEKLQKKKQENIIYFFPILPKF